MKKVLFTRLFSLIVSAIFLSACDSNTEAAAKPVKPAHYNKSKLDALISTHQCIEDYLVSPGSADFGIDYENNVKKVNDSTFTVLSYVDSQNKFGGLMRSYYKCTVIFISKDQWRCEDVQIEEGR